MTALEWVGFALIVASLLPANGIVLLYMRVPWWKSRVGRAIVTMNGGFALLLDLALLRLVLPATVVDALRLAVYPVVLAGLWLQYQSFRHTLALAKVAEDLEELDRTDPPPPRKEPRRGYRSRPPRNQ